MGLLSGLTAIVTGGESGIGRATALAVAQAGGNVAVTYFTDRDAADDVVSSIGKTGARGLAFKTDVGREDDVDVLFGRAEQEFGVVDLLVNSAGLNMSGTRIEEMTLAQFRRVLDADLIGPFLTCRRFVQGLEKAGRGGRIVNISSIHERAPRSGGADYDAAKGGLAQLTRTLALELALRHIAVNGIAPGMIMTAMNQDALNDPELLRMREAAIPWGRAGRPEEVADLAVFLLSPAADYITGTTVTIDGALSLTVAQGA